MNEEYYATLPVHPRIGEYLLYNPHPGVEAQKTSVGNVAIGWPTDLPHPDVDAWIAEREAFFAKQEEERVAQEAEEVAAAEATRAELAAKIASVREGKASNKDIADLLSRVLL